MKAAICSDIHGDLPALEAVLAAAANVGADEIWVVGDLVAHGPHPAPWYAACGPSTRNRWRAGCAWCAATPTGMSSRETFLLTCWRSTANGFRTRSDSSPTPARPSPGPETGSRRRLSRLAGRVAGRAFGRPARRVARADGACSSGYGRRAWALRRAHRRRAAGAGVTDAGVDLVLVGHTHVPMDRVVDGVGWSTSECGIPVTDDPAPRRTCCRRSPRCWPGRCSPST